MKTIETKKVWTICDLEGWTKTLCLKHFKQNCLKIFGQLWTWIRTDVDFWAKLHLQQGKCVCINKPMWELLHVYVCVWDYKDDLAMIILAADHVSAWRGNMYRVQDWPQHLTKWPERERESI